MHPAAALEAAHMFPDANVHETETYIENFDPSPSDGAAARWCPAMSRACSTAPWWSPTAAEQNARMSAMDSATDNAKEIAQPAVAAL